jgi:hypothetical protein
MTDPYYTDDLRKKKDFVKYKQNVISSLLFHVYNSCGHPLLREIQAME